MRSDGEVDRQAIGLPLRAYRIFITTRLVTKELIPRQYKRLGVPYNFRMLVSGKYVKMQLKIWYLEGVCLCC